MCETKGVAVVPTRQFDLFHTTPAALSGSVSASARRLGRLTLKLPLNQPLKPNHLGFFFCQGLGGSKMLPLIQRLRTNPLSIFTGFSMDCFQLNPCFLEQLRSRP
jgi:hypothetical protein